VSLQNVSFLKLANGIESAWKRVSDLASLPKKSMRQGRKRVQQKNSEESTPQTNWLIKDLLDQKRSA